MMHLQACILYGRLFNTGSKHCIAVTAFSGTADATTSSGLLHDCTMPESYSIRGLDAAKKSAGLLSVDDNGLCS